MYSRAGCKRVYNIIIGFRVKQELGLLLNQFSDEGGDMVLLPERAQKVEKVSFQKLVLRKETIKYIHVNECVPIKRLPWTTCLLIRIKERISFKIQFTILFKTNRTC